MAELTVDFLRNERLVLEEQRQKALASAQRAAGAIVFIDNLIAHMERDPSPGEVAECTPPSSPT